jgi:hypothetical protein
MANHKFYFHPSFADSSTGRTFKPGDWRKEVSCLTGLTQVYQGLGLTTTQMMQNKRETISAITSRLLQVQYLGNLMQLTRHWTTLTDN